MLENIRRRDSNDRGQWAPLVKSGQAIVIDTSQMSIHDVVDRMMEVIESRKQQA